MSSARRAASLLRLSSSAIFCGPASVFPMGSSRCGLSGGVGSAPVLSGGWVPGLAPVVCGPGDVLSVVLVTACVPPAAGAAVGWAVVAGRCAPAGSEPVLALAAVVLRGGARGVAPLLVHRCVGHVLVPGPRLGSWLGD